MGALGEGGEEEEDYSVSVAVEKKKAMDNRRGQLSLLMQGY